MLTSKGVNRCLGGECFEGLLSGNECKRSIIDIFWWDIETSQYKKSYLFVILIREVVLLSNFIEIYTELNDNSE